jgi:hypothetical protein
MMSGRMKPNSRTFVLLCCALAAVLFAMRQLKSQSVKASLDGVESELPASSADAEPALAPADVPVHVAANSARMKSVAPPASEQRRAADRTRALLADRRALVAQRAPEPLTMPAPVGSGNQVNQALGAYVRAVMQQQFFPLAKSCYENLLAKRKAQSGKVVFNVRVVGDASVGGVVDAVEVEPSSSLRDEELVTCVRESMFSVQFDAPPPGEKEVTFTMPIDFSPGG